MRKLFVVRIRSAQAAAILALAGLLFAPPQGNGQTPVSLAVLPFANASGDASQDPFVDGLTDEISAAVAKVPALHVGARASAFRYKGPNQDFRTIGQELKKTHL